MIPLNLVEVLENNLDGIKEEHTKTLRASSDLLGSLRHAQLRLAGAPELPDSIVSKIRKETGTMWHRRLGETFLSKGIPFMQEVRVTDWLPEGWGGRVDWLFWNEKHGAFVLGDLKTAKGESNRFLKRDGMKPEHRWQLSAYWHALVEAGFPLIAGIFVFYLPMNDTQERGEVIEPIIAEADPLPKDQVWEVMSARWDGTSPYLDQVYAAKEHHDGPGFPIEGYLQDKLAPEIERSQYVSWNKARGVFNVILTPHWSTKFCPYDNALCACSEQGLNKIGEYRFMLDPGKDLLEYVPRGGYEGIEPTVRPEPKDAIRRAKEINA